MVKGISRRVVVVESPDPRIFEQAIFIVRDTGIGSGVSSQEIVEEARRVAKSYAQGAGSISHRWRSLNPALYTGIGAGSVGLLWLMSVLA